jgi:hypothetical protein
MINIKRRDLLLGLGVAGAGIALVPGIVKAQSKKAIPAHWSAYCT